MITKASIVGFFTKGKIIFASVAAVNTFDPEKVYAPLSKSSSPEYARKTPAVMRAIQQLHFPKRNHIHLQIKRWTV
jgi:hypothetical protein